MERHSRCVSYGPVLHWTMRYRGKERAENSNSYKIIYIICGVGSKYVYMYRHILVHILSRCCCEAYHTHLSIVCPQHFANTLEHESVGDKASTIIYNTVIV